MKTVIAKAAALALSACVLCGGAFGVETTASVSQDWNVKAEYPVLGIGEIDKAIQEWLGEHIRRNVADSAGVVVDPGFPDGGWTMEIFYAVTRPSDHAVSYAFSTYVMPKGAAHPMAYVDVLSFDVATGEQLTFDKVFARPDAALAIMAEHAPALVRESMTKEEPETAKYLDNDIWFKDGFEPKASNYAALVLEPGGVRVVFQKYQILPYVFGNPEAFFPLSLLEPAGPNLVYWENL